MRVVNNIEISRKRNALVVLLYFFQYGLLLPFSAILGNVVVAIFTLCLVSYSIVKGQIKFSKGTLLLLFVPLMVLLLKLPFEPVTYDVGIEILLSFLMIGVSGILVGTLPFYAKDFLYYAERISWLNFFLVGILVVTPLYNNQEEAPVNYMKFGYAMLPSVIFAFYFIMERTRIDKNLLLFILSFLLLFIFGARGAMLTFVVFAFLHVLIVAKLKIKLLLMLVVMPLMINLSTLIFYVEKVLAGYNISSYALTKYLMLLTGSSLEATSSGRGEIFNQAISRLSENPIIGLPLNTALLDTGSTYYHNLFLDIGVNFGLFFLIFFFVFLIWILFRILITRDKSFQAVFLVFMVVAIGRLLVSSSLWQRPEFWLFMSCAINYRKREKGIL